MPLPQMLQADLPGFSFTVALGQGHTNLTKSSICYIHENLVTSSGDILHTRTFPPPLRCRDVLANYEVESKAWHTMFMKMACEKNTFTIIPLSIHIDTRP